MIKIFLPTASPDSSLSISRHRTSKGLLPVCANHMFLQHQHLVVNESINLATDDLTLSSLLSSII